MYRIRYICVILSGMLAALGGAYLSIGFVGSFGQNMTAGRGFIALAAVIFGKWRPYGAFGACLLFGFASGLADRLQSVASVSPNLLNTLPYVLTLIALVGLVGRSRPPAADGQPYVKGCSRVRIVDVIARKRDGGELSAEEIRAVVDPDVPDYQAAAFLMAVVLRGLSDRETADLLDAMVDSGERIDLSPVGRPVADKHSTGGVGDKTTLVVAPLVAAGGTPVAKLSGRGLGHTGGTLDKLESIPGFRVDLSIPELVAQVAAHGIAVAAQTADIVPADKRLYALRDVTATVPSIPLIATSIMSKKIAAGASRLVLDVKVGEGAFMEDLESARTLSRAMMRLGDAAGLPTTCMLSLDGRAARLRRRKRARGGRGGRDARGPRAGRSHRAVPRRRGPHARRPRAGRGGAPLRPGASRLPGVDRRPGRRSRCRAAARSAS